MKRITKLLLIFVVTLFISTFSLFNTLQIGETSIGLSFPCACMTTKDLVNIDLVETKQYVSRFYKDKKYYPKFEELINYIENYNNNLYLSLRNGREIKPREMAVYYTVSSDQKRYQLQGFAIAKLGNLSIVVDIESNISDTLYDFN